MAGYIGSKAVLLSTTAATVTGDAEIAGDLTVGSNALFVDQSTGDISFYEDTGTTPKLFWDASAEGLNLGASSAPFGKLDVSDVGGSGVATIFDAGANGDNYLTAGTSGIQVFRNGSTERMRIDSSGNVLVGTTNSTPGVGDTDTGCSISGGGFLFASRNAGSAGYFNRNTSDGPLVTLYKEGAAVGAIATYGGLLAIEGVTSAGAQVVIRSNGNACLTLGAYAPNDAFGYIGDTSGSSVGMAFISDSCDPVNAGTGQAADNLYDIGAGSRRWDDIYATNGTIQTSDANEKQQIAELTAAEMQAAKAISKLFKTFKWNDSVAEKGDDARIHSGVIAQEVEAAMADAGLDAGKYAFFISSTWWEADGQTYDTAEEAPTGAVERTRKGIRYPQLLSFIGAATEQRLASIEARLDALEAN